MVIIIWAQWGNKYMDSWRGLWDVCNNSRWRPNRCNCKPDHLCKILKLSSATLWTFLITKNAVYMETDEKEHNQTVGHASR